MHAYTRGSWKVAPGSRGLDLDPQNLADREFDSIIAGMIARTRLKSEYALQDHCRCARCGTPGNSSALRPLRPVSVLLDYPWALNFELSH